MTIEYVRCNCNTFT